MAVAPASRTGRRLERVAHRLLHSLILLGLLLMVAVVIVPIAEQDHPGDEAPLIIALPLVLVLGLFSNRVARFVDWLLYGSRDDPSAAAWQVARELESASDEQTLPALLSAMAATLRLSYVEVRVGETAEEHPVATHGTPSSATTAFELRHAGRRLGLLLASRRGQPLGREDGRLLRAMAAQLAVVLHARELNADLRRARETLVLSREDERRRLRRDLHDGVGPALAGIALGLESVDASLTRAPDQARQLLGEVQTEIRGVIVDVRRAVDGLRPPMLDEVGLSAAVERMAQAFADRTGVALDLDIEPLPRLAAAVEVGAYRIAVEALTNAARHASAQRWTVALRRSDEALHITVADDGVGLGAAVPGTGLSSLRERAEELGGRVSVESSADGTRVEAELPVDRPSPAGADDQRGVVRA